MTDAQRTLRLFEQAVMLEPQERDGFLVRECDGDAALRAEIDALLAADAAAGDFLAHPFGGTADRAGEHLGAYRLLRLIGSGGMGSVYRAERADGAFAKPVAIKLLLFDAGDLRMRFALEQRILGALSHPNIASLLDVGHDANGAPYLVMEFVEGQPITAYVHDHDVAVRERIGLFLKILDAVQTAHSQLVVHRDIKPGNVLIDAHGEPKLLDFGIAKLLGDNVPSATRTGLGPLTPEYASPEQVRGEPIGTASDIYSLGVLLFELVTGERPYHIDVSRASTIEHIVCDTDPPRPSTHLTTRRIGGSARDLDAIILKAMAKRAAQRYATCSAFAEDLERWLARREVMARYAPWSERSLRILRRHRLITAVAATATITLLAGSTVALWQAHLAREQAAIASTERDRAERINHSLTGMLASADPADLGRRATVADVLDHAQAQAERDLASDPGATAQTELTLARTYSSLGNLDAAMHSAELALSAAQRASDADTTIEAQITLGDTLKQRGDLASADKPLTAARAAAIAHGTPLQRARAAHTLGSLANARGDYAEAQRWYEIALKELPVDAESMRADVLNDYAIVKSSLGDDAGALKLLEQVVATERVLYPKGNPHVAQSLRNLADAQEIHGDIVNARNNFASALAMQIELLGPNHPDVVSTLSSITNLDIDAHDTAGALDHGARAWSAAQSLSADNPNAGYAAIMYGEALLLAQRAPEAKTLFETALKMRKARFPADHPAVVNTESVLGLAQALSGDITGGEALAKSAYERQLAKLGEKHTFTTLAKQRLDQIEALKKPPSAAR